MDIEIDAQSRLTIIEQIVVQTERLVADGKLKTGDILPSVKELADRLQISRRTTMKAYEELCGKGIAEHRAGQYLIY
jgi:DNA-binding transcriptional regulator YhcF (GntR family)